MSAMYRLKAYFGMVPAEEMADYAEDTVADRYGARSGRAQGDGWDDRFPDDEEPERARYEDEWDRRPARPVAVERSREPARVASAAGRPGLGVTDGALAIDTSLREPPRSVGATAGPVPEQRDRVAPGVSALSRITTLQPRSYNEARTIGERYRDGVPVIMNLTELDDAAAKRLVDFAAGLAFALRGSIDKVTSRVFLLTPADVEVSADDARKLAERSVGGGRMDAERGYFRQD